MEFNVFVSMAFFASTVAAAPLQGGSDKSFDLGDLEKRRATVQIYYSPVEEDLAGN